MMPDRKKNFISRRPRRAAREPPLHTPIPHDSLIDANILWYHSICIELRDGPLAAASAHLFSQAGIEKHLQAPLCHGIDISEWHQVPGLSVLDHFRKAANSVCNNRDFASHGLECRKTKRFGLARDQQQI